MTERRRIRTAVLGLGRIAWGTHLPELLAHGGFELVGLVDPDEGRLEEGCREFGVAGGYRTTEELYAAARPELVVIASPTLFHHDQAVEAFKQGSDVFCDKPMALELEQADSMIREQRRLGRKLMIYQPYRYSPETVILQDILASGKLGRIFQVKRSVNAYVRRNDWQALRKFGGGMLNNYGSHQIDMMIHLFHEEIVRVHCEMRTIAALGDAEDMVRAMLTTREGTLFDLEINMAQSIPTVPWAVCGTLGTAVLDPERRPGWQLRYHRPEHREEVELDHNLAAAGRRYPSGGIGWIEEEIPLPTEDRGAFFRDVYNYFALGAAPFVPVEETREVMRIIEACRGSARADLQD